MPPIVCTRCRRANPPEAFYCHFDGTELRGPAPGAPGRATLAHEFVFPSGRRCRTFDELVQGLLYEWEDARDLLRKGVLDKYLAGLGRMDLAAAAREARALPDPDIGLYNLVHALPEPRTPGPRLELSPRRLVLGPVRAGDTAEARLTVSNSGRGLLQGKVARGDGAAWLRLPGDPGGASMPVKTPREQEIVLRLDTRGLPADRTCSTTLRVVTNGGIVEVPVRLAVAARPLADSVFGGAASPRELAERMKANPKAAVTLLQSGAAARWFADNGWPYPVQGPTARGVAAVQQFFEGMGLSRAPQVALDTAEVSLAVEAGAVITGRVTVRTPSRKWVYATALSDAPWLRLPEPSVGGPQAAAVPYEVDTRQLTAGQRCEGHINLLANAGQKLQVRVRLDVHPAQRPEPRPSVGPLAAGALLGLLYRLALAVPLDLAVRVLLARPGAATVPPGSFPAWLRSPLAEPGTLRSFVLLTWWLGAVIGAVLLWRRGQRRSDVLFGATAGAIAGALVMATVACLAALGDALPRYLWGLLATVGKGGPPGGAAWLWTPLWILLAAACWAALGLVAGGVLAMGGPPGRRLLDALSWPWRWLPPWRSPTR